LKKVSILIVDPEISHRDYLAMTLNSQGFDVYSASGGEEALNKFSYLKPDMILLDEEVNGLTTRQLARELQARNPDSFYIVMSKQADLESAMDWIMAGALTYLRKPVQLEKLKQAIDTGLENKKAFHDILKLTRSLKTANQKMKKNQELLVKERTALKDKTQQIRFLYELSTELSASLRSRTIFDLVHHALDWLINPHLTIILSDFAPQGKVRLYTSRCLSSELSKSLIEELMTHLNKDLSGKDFEQDISKPTKSSRRLSRRPPYRIILPLVVAGEKYGLLALYFYRKPEQDNDRTLLLESVAMQAAQAIRNAHQHEIALQMANRDPLTGLYNRRAFEESLNKEFKRVLRYQRPMSLIMIDLDHFKTVNDRFGHQTGDKVLKTVAHVIADCTRATDITARFGGEEFVIILPDTQQDKALFLAERIRKKITHIEIPVNENSFKLTVSQGLAATNTPEVKRASDLIDLADRALYQAKEDGRNAIRTAQDLNIGALITSLKEASHA